MVLCPVQVARIAGRLLRRMHVYEQVVRFTMLAGQLVGAQVKLLSNPLPSLC